MRLRRTGRRRVVRRRMPRKFRRTGLRRKSAYTQVRVHWVDYISMSSTGSGLPAYTTAQYHIQNIMGSLIASAPAAALVGSYEFAALKWAKVTFHASGVHPLSNVTANSLYPPLHSAMVVDSYSSVTGLGAYPARAIARMPGSSQVLGRGRVAKTFYTASICKRLSMPYWQPTSLSSGSYYIPPSPGVIPIATLAVNTVDGVPNSGTTIVGMVRVTGVLQFKNMKLT